MAEFIKNLKKKVEHYKTKAEEIRAMIEEGAETIRDIRADVESTVEDLKADSDEKLMESLEKIQDAERVFKEAGYKLRAMKMEMGFNPKVIAMLRREKEIGTRQQERLLKQHADNKLIKSMLTSLFKAEYLEDKVHLRDLTFSEVHIEVGLVPAVHVLWVDQSADEKKAAERPRSSISSSPFTSSRSSFTSSSSFSSSSSAFGREEPEEEEEVVEHEEEYEELMEEEPEAEAEAEETDPAPKKKRKKKSSGPVVSTSARDPEDDKWTSFPDISFPTIN
jgi:hypothetical protein